MKNEYTKDDIACILGSERAAEAVIELTRVIHELEDEIRELEELKEESYKQGYEDGILEMSESE